MREILTAVLAAAALALGLTALSFPGGQAGLGDGLGSLRVLRVNSGEGSVSYFPAKARWVVSSGEREAAPQLLRVDVKRVLISGGVSLLADAADVSALRRRAGALFGREAQLLEAAPRSSELHLLDGGAVVWSRPAAGGAVKNIPVQAMLTREPRERSNALKLVGVVTWSESVEPLGVSLQINWDTIVEAFEAEAKRGGGIDEEKVLAIAEQSLTSGWVKLQTSGGDAPPVMGVLKEHLRLVISTHVKRTLLASGPPAPQKVDEKPSESAGEGTAGAVAPSPTPEGAGWRVTYRIREDVRRDSLASSLDLRVGTFIDRTLVVESSLPLSF